MNICQICMPGHESVVDDPVDQNPFVLWVECPADQVERLRETAMQRGAACFDVLATDDDQMRYVDGAINLTYPEQEGALLDYLDEFGGQP